MIKNTAWPHAGISEMDGHRAQPGTLWQITCLDHQGTQGFWSLNFSGHKKCCG